MVSYPSSSGSLYAPDSGQASPAVPGWETNSVKGWLVFAAAIFLVTVPVFFQAPLVRSLPWLSLALSVAWFGWAWRLLSRPQTHLWGDLLLGFAWTWLTGSLYWGWLRWEPFLHLPVEAIGLPFALWGLARRREMVGNLFYLGSLFGTVLTDLYFYLVGLIPHWRQLMQVEPELVRPIFQQAITQIHTPWGLGWVAVLAMVLAGVGIFPLYWKKVYWMAFSGAVLSTILVDGLFWLVASLA